MFTIRSRRDLSLLLEKQMTAASTRPGGPAIDEDIEGRTALKTYLLEAHGRMRAEPVAALTALCEPMGISVEPTDDPTLIELALGDLQLWMDVSGGRVHRLYTVGQARDTDRIHASLVAGSGLLECVWLPPRALETLTRHPDTRMVLFSLRHDRRVLRRTPDEQGIDSVTLRFWGPRARETLEKLRKSDVLPHATSVFSVRVRTGDEEKSCLAEVFHTGKVTAVGTSFEQHERLLRALLDEHLELVDAIEQAQRTPRRVHIPVRWTLDDLSYGVGKMFSGAEPFRLWGVPVQVGEDEFRVRAVDLDVGQTATFEVNHRGVTLELGPRTPASVAIRFVSALQYHINADLQDDVLSPDPLLQLAQPLALDGGAFNERAKLHHVAQVLLPEACAQWVRGAAGVTTTSLLEGTHGGDAPSEALHNLVRQVMSEAAAHEWRPWLKLVMSGDGRPSWRFHDPLPIDSTPRLRELVKLNRASQQLVARMSGTALARWLQLSLFGPESMVTPMSADE